MTARAKTGSVLGLLDQIDERKADQEIFDLGEYIGSLQAEIAEAQADIDRLRALKAMAEQRRKANAQPAVATEQVESAPRKRGRPPKAAAEPEEPQTLKLADVQQLDPTDTGGLRPLGESNGTTRARDSIKDRVLGWYQDRGVNAPVAPEVVATALGLLDHEVALVVKRHPELFRRELINGQSCYNLRDRD